MRKATLFASMTLLAAFAVAFAKDDKDEKKDEFKAICPVSGEAAKKDKTLKYREGEVYFCCENCPKAFEKDTAKYAEKANHQLVLTGQYKQIKCPLTGGKLNPEAKSEIDHLTVNFCCNMCKGKVDDAKGEEQYKLVFADKAFDKGFELVKKEKKE